MTIKYICIAFLVLFIAPCVDAQEVATGGERNNVTPKRTPALRIGAGLTPDLYGEAGISFHKYHYQFLKSTSSAWYAALEVKPTMYLDRGFLMLGPKIGYEVSAYGVGAGVEAKYQSDGKNKDFVLAPKAGFSLMGLANLFYGYNISFNNYPLPGVGRHQFSLVFNLYTKPMRRGALMN